jgi:hypothetical protein
MLSGQPDYMPVFVLFLFALFVLLCGGIGLLAKGNKGGGWLAVVSATILVAIVLSWFFG